MMPYYNQFQQPMFFQNPYQQAQVQQNVQPPIQNGGFISVRNLEEARNWPIAPGNSITFKDESAPYIYTKTMGYNQLDTPRFERYRLVKEETPQSPVNAPTSPSSSSSIDLSGYALKTDVEAVSGLINEIKDELAELRAKTDKPTKQTVKKEADS